MFSFFRKPKNAPSPTPPVNYDTIFNQAVDLHDDQSNPHNPARAVALYERAIAEGGDVDSMYNLALLLGNGADGVEKDAVRAVALYERAIADGRHFFSMSNLALLLENGADGVEKDAVRAVALYERAIAEGRHVDSMYNLARLLVNGADGVEKDAVRAVALYERAIAEGRHVNSMYNLARLLENGADGVEKDAVRAVTLYERAIAEGRHVNSMYNLARLLENGADGVEKDAVRAVELYERAIAEGRHVFSMYNLARLLEIGADGVEKDAVRAVALYERAIVEGGDVLAMSNLALVLRSGSEGVARDIPRAISLFEEAANVTNSAEDLFLLGETLLGDDIGELRNPVRAKELLEQAIEFSNYGPAMHALAVLLNTGDEGVARDVGRAAQLYQQAEMNATWKLQNFSPSTWWRIEDQIGARYEAFVEQLLKTETVRPRRCFLLTLGGGGRGKTFVVRSLRRMEFVPVHRETELYELNRFIVVPGEEKMQESTVAQLFENSETLFAAFTRIVRLEEKLSNVQKGGPGVLSHTKLRELQYGKVPIHESVQPPSTGGKLGSSTKDFSTAGRIGTPSNYSSGHVCHEDSSLNVTQGRGAWHPENVARHVIFKTRSALRTNSFPEAPDCALVECWDAGGQHPYRMAHSLFLKRASLLVFVANLENIANEGTRFVEVKELCEWIELAYAHAVERDEMRIMIVGTRKDSCGDVEIVWGILKDEIRKGLGTDSYMIGRTVYNSWIMEGERRGPIYVAIENKNAAIDPHGSGLQELESAVKKMADSIVAARDAVPARWVALVEEMEKFDKVFLTETDVEMFANKFPGFEREASQRAQDVMKAFEYFAGTGRLLLMEKHGGEYYVFMHPEKIVNFIRLVTGPERTIEQRLDIDNAHTFSKGLLTRSGLDILWRDYSPKEREVILDLLCQFDLLMKVPCDSDGPSNARQLIAIPALLPEETTGLRWAKTKGEVEIVMITEFMDFLPPGIIGMVIANLHRTLGGQRTKAEFIKAIAVLLSVGGSTSEHAGSVAVEFDKTFRRIVWTVRAKHGMEVMRKCLRAFEECMENPVRCITSDRKHYLLGVLQPKTAGMRSNAVSDV